MSELQVMEFVHLSLLRDAGKSLSGVGEEPIRMSLQSSVFQLWIPVSSFEAWISQKAEKLSSLCNILTKMSTASVNIPVICRCNTQHQPYPTCLRKHWSLSMDGCHSQCLLLLEAVLTQARADSIRLTTLKINDSEEGRHCFCLFC